MVLKNDLDDKYFMLYLQHKSSQSLDRIICNEEKKHTANLAH